MNDHSKSIDKLFELVREVRDSAIRTEEHLRTLNGQVAEHARQIGDLNTTDTKLLAQFAPILEHVNEEKARANKRWDFWRERLVWIAGLLALAVLYETGILTLNIL